MIIAVTKIEFYTALLKQAIDNEQYETCAKLRDTINAIDNIEELYIFNTDETDENNSNSN